MLVQFQSTTSQPPLHHHHVSHSSTFCYSISFPSGFPNSTLQKTTTTVIKCCSKENVKDFRYGRKKGNKTRSIPPNWKTLYKRMTNIENPEEGGPTAVLEEWESEGHLLNKWQIRRIVKEMRKLGRNKPALEAFEWMTNRGERFRLSPGDTAIELDLIARVHGISGAEEYFLKLPNTLKDGRTYGALLNAYGSVKLKEKGESLMAQMKERGYANRALPFNVMMTLYMHLKLYDKVELTISEMMDKKIRLDIYSYNIWLSSRGSHGSAERMEQVFEQMKLVTSISPNWTTFSIMAGMYIKFGRLEKAEDCLKKLEVRIKGRDRIPYHFLMTHYGNARNREEVKRIWSNYKTVFPFTPNMGYLSAISSFIRVDDIEEAEKLYEEWLSARTNYEPRIGNLLLGWYVAKGEEEKAEAFFSHMGEAGKRRNSRSWEILAEVFIKEGRVSEAVDYLEKAVATEGAECWNINPVNVTSILNLLEQEGNSASKEILLRVLRQAGCFEDEAYRSYFSASNALPRGNELPTVEKRTDEDLDEVLVDQLQASL